MFEKVFNQKNWFEKLVGFKEENPRQVRANLVVENDIIKSKINGKTYNYGQLEIATLEELKEASPDINQYDSQIRIAELVGDVRVLHADSNNENAVFQAASQFNLLEMVSPKVTPEDGIGIYEQDHTQGPACAIACGAGTIYRNYFVEISEQIGQTENTQIDCLDEIGKALNNENSQLWKMQNGYALANLAGLKSINNQLSKLSLSAYEDLKGKLKVGLQWNTEVTIAKAKHSLTQVYCSALPIAYSQIDSKYWETFAKLILEATYEATFYAALKNYELTGSPKLFLTLVGGGVFGNELEWILEAIEKSMQKFQKTPLNVNIVSYGNSNPELRKFLNRRKP